MVSTAIQQTAVARVVGIKTEFINFRTGVTFLPRQIAVLGQGNTDKTYPLDKYQVLSEAEAGRRYGFGSPIHLAVRELKPNIGTGVGTVPVFVLPLEDDTEGVAAAGSIEPDATALPVSNNDSYRVFVGGIPSQRFVIDGDDDEASIVEAMADAINAVTEMPVSATANTTATPPVVELDALWAGESGNSISLSIEADGDGDAEFTITEMSGGLVNPDVQAGLDKIGDSQWITEVVNCLNPDDETALDALEAYGEQRWQATIRKPLVAFRGTNETAVQDATAITSERPTDRVNCQIATPGSPNMPVTIAAQAVNSIARLATNNPPHDYGSRPLPRLTPGPDSDQWNFATRDTAVKNGTSTIEIKDGEINLSDVVTSYAPEGEIPPGYRYVVDIVKLQQIIFNLDLIFNTPKWDGAPLIPDDQPTTNPDAKKPSDAKAAVSVMLDSLGDNAIISDPATAKDNMQAQIDDQNPKRLNIRVPTQVSGNTNIRSIDLDFGFYFSA